MAEFVELGLTKHEFVGNAERTDGFARLCDALIQLIAASVPEEMCADATAFRQSLESSRRRIQEAPDRTTFDQEAGDCVALCQRQFDQMRRAAIDRDTGYAEIVDVLTRAVDEIAGHSSAFNATVLGESDRMRRLVFLNDIRELKKQVTERVESLRRAVAEKEQRDEAHRSQLANRVKVLQSSLSDAQTEASVDALTGIANRRGFERKLSRFMATAADVQRPFTLSLIDVDDFKRVNDEHGHLVGDQVLVALAQDLSRALRKTDVAARYGGEEFAVLLENTHLAQAAKKIAGLLQDIAHSEFVTNDAPRRHISLTVSAGVAEYVPDDTDASLIKRADEGLYAAKRAGKNRVVANARQAPTNGTANT